MEQFLGVLFIAVALAFSIGLGLSVSWLIFASLEAITKPATRRVEPALPVYKGRR